MFYDLAYIVEIRKIDCDPIKASPYSKSNPGGKYISAPQVWMRCTACVDGVIKIFIFVYFLILAGTRLLFGS